MVDYDVDPGCFGSVEGIGDLGGIWGAGRLAVGVDEVFLCGEMAGVEVDRASADGVDLRFQIRGVLA